MQKYIEWKLRKVVFDLERIEEYDILSNLLPESVNTKH